MKLVCTSGRISNSCTKRRHLYKTCAIQFIHRLFHKYEENIWPICTT
uniref:Uncharacterized protein n=1 Tax=Anguilla anguilla TaxID=7936 RepID=A0A0E9XH41_ANGAN